MERPATTPDRLLDAAARLFAERGVDNVPLAEIVRAAGQRNTSAVHYHFGSRDEILRAVLARHVPAIAERRQTLLAEARARPDTDVRSAAEAVVRPITEFAQGGWRERAYLQIGSELSRTVERESAGVRELMAQTAGQAAWKVLRSRCAEVPADLWRQRQQICIVFIGGAGGERADGWFAAPTAFGDVDHHSDLAREEVFGPVQAIIRFRTDEEVLDRANDSPFGLGAYLHTRDLGRIQRFVRELEAGTVAVNGMGGMSPATPFGGFKQSGYGREGGRAGIEEMVRSKTVFVAP